MNLRPNWRLVGIAAGGVAAALLLALVLFVVFFPKQLAAREAERRIEAATERDLVLGGDIDVSLWPALGFAVEQAALSNPPGFPADERFIAADRIVFAVKLLPLLRGAIEVKQLIFEGADVRLRAKADGAANWAFPTQTTDPDDRTTIEDLRLDDVRFSGGRVSFQGGDSDAPLVLENVDAALALDSLDAPAQLNAAFDWRGQRLDIEGEVGLPRAVLEKATTPLRVLARAAPLDAQFDGSFDAASGALTGQVEAEGESLRRLLAWVGSPMAEGGGFGRFAVAARLAHRDHVTALSGLTLRLDDIAARGALTLRAPPRGSLRIDGALSAAALDLNHYLPAPAQGADAASVDAGSAWSAEPLDLSGLRALDANVDLTLGQLRFQRMSFADVALNLRLAGGAADARLSRVSLYEGGGVARLIADGSGAVPRLAVEIDAQNVQAEPLLRDAVGFDRIVGRGRLRASLVGQGGSQAAIMRSLRGNASFDFNDGQWKGVNLAQVARTVQAAVSGRPAGQGGATDFAELAASFAIAGGAAATQDLRLLNPFVRLEGRGVVDLGAQTIDMRIAPRAVRSIEGQGGDAGLAGLGVPFRISGPWARVSFRPALEDVVQDRLRDILRRQDEGSPLAQLGEALFGGQAATPAESEGAAPPADAPPPPEPDEPRNPLADIFRRAMQGDDEKEQAPTP